MIKLGLVGALKTHAYVFAAIFNGGEEKEWPADAWKPEKMAHINDAKIVKVWGQTKEAAEMLAEICNIPQVVSEPEQAADDVDAVIITDDSTLTHSKHWRHFLEKGILTFIDKPLADTLEKAEEIIKFVKKNNSLMMSASALRYAAEMPEFLEKVGSIGNIRTGLFTGRPKGRLINYGIHAVEMFYSVVKPHVKSVRTVGEPGGQIIKLNCDDGRIFIFNYSAGLPWEISLHGENGCASMAVKDNDYYFFNLMNHFIKMVKQKKLFVPLNETLQIMKLCFAIEKSLETSNEVFLVKI